ncbi:MAG: glycosyltransferase [Planctomycetia bacterium]
MSDTARHTPPSAAAPTVSVVVVCYNDWPDVELAVESALNQSHEAVEVIVVDNGSTDATAELLPARFGDRIRYVRQDNRGAAGGRNTGLALCTGDYIQFLDGDDVLAPNKFAKQVDFLEVHPEFDGAYGSFRCFRSTPDVPSVSLFDIDPPRVADGDLRRMLLVDGCPPPICFLFRRSVYERIGAQDESVRRAEDYEYWLRAAFAGCLFAPTPESLSFYRRRVGQKSQHRVTMARGELTVLQRASRYVVEEPYRGLLQQRRMRLRYLLSHHYLWTGNQRRARGSLALAKRLAPENFPHDARGVTATLSRIPGGASVYQLARRLRRLAPPFEPAMK